MLMPSLLLAVSLAAVVASRTRTGDFLTPPALFVATWCGCLALYFMYLLPYRPMHSRTAVLILASVVVFVAGSVLGDRWGRRKAEDGGRARSQQAETWVTVFATIGLLGVVWYIVEVARVLGWSAFESGAVLRTALGNYTIPSTFLFLEYFCIVAPLLAFALLITGVQLRARTKYLAVLCVMATWITTDRTQFFLIVLGAFFMYLYRKGSELSWGGLVRTAAVCAVLLITNFLIVGRWVGKTPENLGLRMQVGGSSRGSREAGGPQQGRASQADGKNGSVPAALVSLMQRGTTLYLYSTGSFAALDVLLQEEIPRDHGLHSAYPIARFLQRIGVLDVALPNAIPPPRRLRLSEKGDLAFNGYTLLYTPLLDFGRVGVVIYVAVIGVLAGWMYARMRTRRDSPLYLLLICHLSTALILSIFVNKFSNTAAWYITLWSVAPFLFSRGLKTSRATEPDFTVAVQGGR